MDFLPQILLAATAVTSGAGLEALRWEQRVLIVFSTPAGENEWRKQKAFLEGRETDLAERRMTVISVQGDKVVRESGPKAPNLSATALRDRFATGDAPFAAVLVGLDGGEKWRSGEATALDRINEVVDAMPMRRAGTEP